MKHSSKSVVTGINSGLGKYIFENWKSFFEEEAPVGLNRSNYDSWLNSEESRSNHFNTIVHCAFNSKREVEDYKSYLDDNIFFTLRLADLSYSKFVYISTVDVYSEDQSYYSMAKKIAESIVISRSGESHLVLRCSAILGPTMRPNSLTKIINDQDAELSLSGESTFNYVLQKDILKFINESVENDFFGVIDFVSEKDITLKEVSSKYKKSPKFGSYRYQSFNRADLSDTPSLIDKYYKKTSEQVIEEFLNV